MNTSSDWLTKVPDDAKQILTTLASGGHDAVLVGGCVRDLLMGRPVHDFDIATSARPEQVMTLFPHAHPTGLQHGTVTVVKSGEPYEVTTFRVDLGYSDGRRPDAVLFSDNLIEDLRRRDFTINAMALRLTGDIVDPFEGTADIAQGIIRAVGDPLERFSEDSLRILRAIRFRAQLGFSVEEETMRAMQVAAPLLKKVSSERIGQELKKIAEANWLLVLPELASEKYLDTLSQPFPALRQAVQVLNRRLGMDTNDRSSSDKERICSWKLLIHELNELLMLCEFKTNDNVSDSFLATVSLWVAFGEITDEQIQELFRKLAWSKAWTKSVLRIRKQLMAITDYRSQMDWTQAMFGGEAYPVWLASVLKDWLSDVHAVGTSQESSPEDPAYSGTAFATSESRTEYRRLCESAYSKMRIYRIQDLAIDGKALQDRGFEGAKIGSTLKSLAKAVLEGDLENRPQALLTYAKTYQGGPYEHPQ